MTQVIKCGAEGTVFCPRDAMVVSTHFASIAVGDHKLATTIDSLAGLLDGAISPAVIARLVRSESAGDRLEWTQT